MSTSIQIKHVDEKWLSNMVYISTIDMDDINCSAIMNVTVPGSSHKGKCSETSHTVEKTIERPHFSMQINPQAYLTCSTKIQINKL